MESEEKVKGRARRERKRERREHMPKKCTVLESIQGAHTHTRIHSVPHTRCNSVSIAKS